MIATSAGGVPGIVRWRRAAARGVRLALAAAVVWLTGWCAYGLVRLVRGPATTRRPAPADDIPAVDLAWATGGGWKLAGTLALPALELPAPPARAGALRAMKAALDRAVATDPGLESLLPAGPGAQRLAVRQDAAGRTAAELWRLTDEVAALRHWRGAGRSWTPVAVRDADAGWRIAGAGGPWLAFAWRISDNADTLLLVAPAAAARNAP